MTLHPSFAHPHAHIDHSGNLPTLVRNGFDGPIYTTPPMIDLCSAMPLDTADIQESDIKFLSSAQAAGNSTRQGLLVEY